MRMMIRKIRLFILINVVLAALLIAFGYAIFVLNLEIALIASMLIIWSSFRGYKKLVDNAAPNDMTHYRDTVDKLDDPFDLYSEDEAGDEENLSLKKIKPQHLKNTLKTKSGFFSLLRLGAYIYLILALFSLNNHGNFHIPGFLLGLGLGVMLVIWLQPKVETKT